MPENGYIQVHAYESNAEIPLADVAVSITSEDGTALALRLTDRSGRIAPVAVPTPPASESLAPQEGERPFTAVNIFAWMQDFSLISAKGVQVFAGTVTIAPLEMIPLAEFAADTALTEEFNTPPQNL